MQKSLALIDPNAVKVRDVPFHYGPGYDLNTVRPKKKKTNKGLENVIPTGIDDGKGAQKLLGSYVQEVCTMHPRKEHATVNFDIMSEDFKNKPFLKQLNHVQMKTVPQLSQVARQNALHPHHSTHKKKHYIEYSKRLEVSDGTLVHARLSSEFIDDYIVKVLEHGLQKNTVLQQLSLHQNAISDEGVERLCLALRWHPTLHTLWLGANRYTDQGARHLSLLIMRNRKIKELNISNRWPSEIWQKSEYELHPHVTYIGAQYLAKSLMRGSGLTSLSLADQRVRDDGAIYLFEAIQHCNLRALNLRANELTDRCCVEFRAALELNTVLEHVILSHNRIGNDGAINIAYGLARNTSMKCLDLGYNQLSAVGLDALHLCLKYNNSVTSLITVRNLDSDCRAEVVAATRSSVFAFGSAMSSAASVSSTGSQGSAGSPGKLGMMRRMSTRSSIGGANQVLSLDLTVPSGVAIMGRSVHSRSFRSVQIDSFEATRATSVRGASFRALSQKFDAESLDSGDGDASTGSRSPPPGERRRLVRRDSSASPAPMIGRGGSSKSPPLRHRHGAGGGGGTGAATDLAAAAAMAAAAVGEQSPPPPALARRKSVKLQAPGEETPTKSTATIATTESGGRGTDDRNRLQTQLEEDDGDDFDTEKPAPQLQRKGSSKKFLQSFRNSAEQDHEMRQLPDVIRSEPAVLSYLGRPVRSRDVGKTLSIPNLKNIGIRPIRTAISPQKDSAQHLLYLRISTPFDPPNERPYSILKVGQDYEAEARRVRALRQDPQYKYDKAFKIHNTPKVVKHQAALPKVPDYFWDDWRKKIRLQYQEGIDNAPGVVSTRLEPLPGRVTTAPSAEVNPKAAAIAAANAEAARGIRPVAGPGAGAGVSAGVSAAVSASAEQAPGGTGGEGITTELSQQAPPSRGRAHTRGANIDRPTTSTSTGADNALTDPNSAYFIYANDPSQAFRRHLTFKNNGVTPGKILAARRKENAIRRAEAQAQAEAEAAAVGPSLLEGKSSKSSKTIFIG